MSTTLTIRPSAAQIKRFWLYLRAITDVKDKQLLDDYKRRIVAVYSAGRTSSLRELSSEEIELFFEEQREKFEIRDARMRAMRQRLVYLLIERGYVSSVFTEAMQQADGLCKRRFKKSLKGMTYEELPRIISVIENRWKKVRSL